MQNVRCLASRYSSGEKKKTVLFAFFTAGGKLRNIPRAGADIYKDPRQDDGY